MKRIICFDIGGTTIKYAVVNEYGEILFQDRFPTPKGRCSENIPSKISEIISKLRENFKINGIGISSAGIIDSEKGVIVRADNLQGFSGTPICEIVKKSTGLTTIIENDVNAAAIGEMWLGAARGRKDFICITLGTGIGGAIVVNGNLVKGVGGGAGEIGHIMLNENGENCVCGGTGCFERYASTAALIRMYEKRAKQIGIAIDEIDGEKIMNRVEDGEELASEVFDNFISHLANGIITITHLLDPGLIIIGGGISAQNEKFFKKLNDKFAAGVIKDYVKHTKIVQAQLKNDAGIYGACYAALMKM